MCSDMDANDYIDTEEKEIEELEKEILSLQDNNHHGLINTLEIIINKKMHNNELIPKPNIDTEKSSDLAYQLCNLTYGIPLKNCTNDIFSKLDLLIPEIDFLKNNNQNILVQILETIAEEYYYCA